jgi:hypothetical protein
MPRTHGGQHDRPYADGAGALEHGLAVRVECRVVQVAVRIDEWSLGSQEPACALLCNTRPRNRERHLPS